MKRKYVAVASTVLALSLAVDAHADSRVKSKYTSNGQSNETTIYTKGSRQRLEPGPGMAIINQCDLRCTVQLIEKQKNYLVIPATAASSTTPANAAPQASGGGGVVTYTINITDTGERREMFGQTARRVKSITTKEAGPGTCNPGKETIETDGWYIDFNQEGAMCFATPQQAPSQPSCTDETRYNQSGDGKLGYPLSYTLKTTKEDGTVSTMQMEVTEFATASLDAGLFEIPAGYTELKSFTDFSAALAGSSANAPTPAGSSAAAAAAAPKTPGTVRVGVAELNNRTGKSFGSISPRDQLIAELADAKVDAVRLFGLSPAELDEAARKQECDYVLYAEVAEVKKASGGFGGLLSKASSVTGGGASKEKVEAKVEYKLVPVGGSKPLVSATAGGSNGGGFNLKGAVSLAAGVSGFAMFMKMGMFDPKFMSTMGNLNGAAFGGPASMGLPGMPRGGFDAGIGPFMSAMQATQAAAIPAAPTEEGKALSDALGQTAKNVTQALTKKK